jgi:hypothetical protein
MRGSLNSSARYHPEPEHQIVLSAGTGAAANFSTNPEGLKKLTAVAPKNEHREPGVRSPNESGQHRPTPPLWLLQAPGTGNPAKKRLSY